MQCNKKAPKGALQGWMAFFMGWMAQEFIPYTYFTDLLPH